MLDLPGDDRTVGDAYLRSIGERHADRIRAALDDLPDLSDRWRSAETLSGYDLRLTRTSSRLSSTSSSS